MLIANYGLFWRRDQVFWGKKNNKGNMVGHPAGKAPSEENIADFREQRGIYVLYDATFNSVYVGQAGAGEKDLFRRLRDHLSDHLASRWSLFSWFGVRRVLKDNTLAVYKATAHIDMPDVLNHMEAVLIAAAEPPLNRQGGRFGEKALQYLQYTDENRLGLSDSEMLRQIYDETISSSSAD